MRSFPAQIRLLVLLSATIFAASAQTTVGPWTPLFKGIDFSVSTNIPGEGQLPHLQVASALRVDLHDPEVRFITTPRIENYSANFREVGGVTVSAFLLEHGVQAAINANYFSPGSYYLPAKTPMNVYGLQVSEGEVISTQDSRAYSAVIAFDEQNRPVVVHTNWPAMDLAGVFTAVAGNEALVVNGVNIAPRSGNIDTDPRTAFGISEDNRYLYIVAIDGRQPGYSDGAYLYEAAEWLILLGAYNGINVDGGGSTTLVMQDSTGEAIRLNSSSAVADSGRERTVGSHFGIYAAPLPSFFLDVLVTPDDRTATIAFSTQEPATIAVQYGTTPDLGNEKVFSGEPTVDHLLDLDGLAPGTDYYFQLAALDTDHRSRTFHFVTTNYVSTNQVLALTNEWRYASGAPSSPNWTALDYDDSGWSGPGPALLWVDTRAAGPNELVEPRNTQMPGDLQTGFPYITYYFRAEFSLAAVVPDSQLAFSGFIDDGAVFYLNAQEIQRLRVPEGADGNTLASGYPCEGDATCRDEFTITDGASKLLPGRNVLAVEVHNYNARSADITFGVELNILEPLLRTAVLHVQRDGSNIVLTWEADGFILESADSPAGSWSPVAGASGKQYAVPASDSRQFYRLRK